MAGRRMLKRRIIRRSCEFGCMARVLPPRSAQFPEKRQPKSRRQVPQDAQGLSCRRKPPCALKCIETSAVCNSKMLFGTNSVNPFGIRNRTGSGAEGGRTCAHGSVGYEQSRCQAGSRGRSTWVRRMMGMRKYERRQAAVHANRCRKRIILCPPVTLVCEDGRG